MCQNAIDKAVSQVPDGQWGIAVSGGSDSVALLRLLAARGLPDLHVIHLNHQTRGEDSDADARFVAQLAVDLALPFHVATREQIEPCLTNTPKNRSALFRALRLSWFKSVVASQRLCGVILAHHADDQAETVLLRLLRGSGFTGLAGMAPSATVGGLTLLRPLLGVRRAALREYLKSLSQIWREDSSNLSMRYARNRVRIALQERETLSSSLCEIARACRELKRWTRNSAPILPPAFDVHALAGLPEILAHESARRWLIERGVARAGLSPWSIVQLVEMASDAATPARRDFPGGVRVRRRSGVISRA